MRHADSVLWGKASARNEPRLTVRYRSACLLPLKAMSQSLAQRSINRRRHSGTRPSSARGSQCLGMDLASLSNNSLHHHPRHRTRGSDYEATRCTRPGGLLGFSCCRPATSGYYPLGVSSSSHMPLPFDSSGVPSAWLSDEGHTLFRASNVALGFHDMGADHRRHLANREEDPMPEMLQAFVWRDGFERRRMTWRRLRWRSGDGGNHDRSRLWADLACRLV